jgi:regulator of protease activity HflC (stomatin/prohibitin superfamily)
MEKEKMTSITSGYTAILLVVIFIALSVCGFAFFNQSVVLILLSVILIIAAVLTAIGLTVINPNESSVLVLFGEYKGTIKKNGFFWVNPFYIKKKISLRANNLNRDPIKVNDKLGNPIMI